MLPLGGRGAARLKLIKVKTHTRGTPKSNNVSFRDETPALAQSRECAFFLPGVFDPRKRIAQPSLTICRPRPRASAPAGTFSVITEPEPT